jgi:hypothetical protein
MTVAGCYILLGSEDALNVMFMKRLHLVCISFLLELLERLWITKSMDFGYVVGNSFARSQYVDGRGHFRKENKESSNGIELSKPLALKLALQVSFPSSHRNRSLLPLQSRVLQSTHHNITREPRSRSCCS